MLDKNIKIEYEGNKILSISPNEDCQILNKKLQMLINLIEDTTTIKSISIINDKTLKNIISKDSQNSQDSLPYSYDKLHTCVEGIPIEIQGSPLQIVGGNYHQGLKVRSIP